MTETKGTCPIHKVEFILIEGCPQCLAERQKEFEPVPEGEKVEGLSEEEQQYEAAKADQPEPEKDITDQIVEASKVDHGASESAPETALAIRPGADVEVMDYYEEALKLEEYARKRTIATGKDNEDATDDLAIISKIKKAMDSKRKEYLEPLKAQTDAIRDTYNTLMAPVLAADKITRDKMLAYDAEQRRIRAEQEEINRKRQEAAEAEMRLKGELSESVKLVEVAPEAPKQVRTNLGTAGQRENWKYEVVDIAAVPREYLVVDGAMLNAIAKRHHDTKIIPGIRFFNEPIIAVRAR